MMIENLGEEGLTQRDRWAAIAGDLAPLMLVITDPQYRILWVNAEAERAFGPFEELVGRYCYEALAGQDQVCAHCVLAQGHERQAATAGEIIETDEKGKRQYFSVEVIPLRGKSRQECRLYRQAQAGDQAEIVAWLEATTSVTHSRLAELEAMRLQEALEAERAAAAQREEIARQNRELAAFCNIATALAKSLDLAQVLEVAIEQMMALTGADAASVALVDWERGLLELAAARGLSSSLMERLREIPLDRVWDGQVCRSGEAYVLDDATQSPYVFPETLELGFASFLCLPLKSQDRVVGVLNLGSRRKLHFAAAPLEFLMALGAQIGAAIANAQLFKRLADSEQHYRNLFETIADPIALVGLDLTLLDYNPALREALGYTDEELRGMSVADLISPQDYPVVKQRMQDRLAGKPVPSHYEIHCRRKDGQMLDVEISVAPHRVDGRIVCLQVVGRDVTEQKRMQRELIRTEKLSALGQLVSGVAHELNNPLTTILLAAELHLRSEEDEEKRRRLETIITQVQRSRTLTDDLRLFARQDEPRWESVDIGAVLDRVHSLMMPAFRRENMQIVLQRPEHIPTILGDPHQLEQVFVNLMNNARQAMAGAKNPVLPHGGCLRITVTTDQGPQNQNLVRIRFQDTGPGIAPYARERLFDPFFTTKPPGEGTGLGLSVSLSIVESHGGSLNVVDPTPDAAGDPIGATFEVVLPAHEGPAVTAEESPADSMDAAHAAQEAPSVPGDDSPQKLDGLRVLVIDDEAHIVSLIADMLTDYGCEVARAASGAEGLQALRDQPYDVILCDMKMPVMDGITWYRRLLVEHPKLCQRVVFMTGDTATQETYEFLTSIPNPTLEKPFGYLDLLRVVQEVAGGQ